MNPTLKSSRIERERRLDPTRFAREYEAEFTEDLKAFLPALWVDDAVVPGRRELPSSSNLDYLAAVDVNGGGADAFAFAIVHVEAGQHKRVVQDVMRSWRNSRNLEGIVAEISVILRRYRIGEVHRDRYAAGWVVEAFQRNGVLYRQSSLDKSQAYLEVEPLFAQGSIDLLDHTQLQRELKTLERRPRAGGRDRIDHHPGGHDDHANVLCLAAALIIKQATFTPRFWRVGSSRNREIWTPIEL